MSVLQSSPSAVVTEGAAPAETPSVLLSSAVNVEHATPMLRQFLEIKAQYPGVVLLYQMGEFYETFFEDALITARALEITLTARDGGKLGKVPMAGIPIHKADSYVGRLLAKNFRVALCQQTEDPAQAKGLVKRAVTRVLSPGTITDETLLNANSHTYLAAVSIPKALKSNSTSPYKAALGLYGLAYCDVSTGTFCTTQLTETQLLSELDRLQPAEIIATGRKQTFPNGEGIPEWVVSLPQSIRSAYRCTPVDDDTFDLIVGQRAINTLLQTTTVAGTGLLESPEALRACGAIAGYLLTMFPDQPPTFEGIHSYTLDDKVVLNVAARRHLELLHTVKTGQADGALISVLDKTHTRMGARLLRDWVSQPLTNRGAIEQRLDGVEELAHHAEARVALIESLPRIYDLERLAIKVSHGSVFPRDLIALKQSLQQLPGLSNALKSCHSAHLLPFHQLPTAVFQLVALIDAAMADAPPQTLQEGGIFKTGYQSELDTLRETLVTCDGWLADYQEQERERTGVKTLKVTANHAFGYFIEITRAQAAAMNLPDGYHRKQTLTNAERFTTPELKAQESKVQDAQGRLFQLEYELFTAFRQELLPYASMLLTLAHQVATVDVLQSLATVAVTHDYVRPLLDDSAELQLVEGRHPVVETMVSMGSFVANDCALTGGVAEENSQRSRDIPQLLLITGPNMAGKSTYMRQVALIVLMAQMGSFVPARYARIGLVDKVFTRIGAMDDLASGQSTFMVEMQETAQILHGATQKSLVLLDEVGRGTSTFDGVAIAQSVIEHLVTKTGCRTLFATHYHELNALEAAHPSICNVRVGVAETVTSAGLEISFLHKVELGTAQRSYGVHVAKMAGLPASVVQRANRLLGGFEKSTQGPHSNEKTLRRNGSLLPETPEPLPQLSLF
ncbi:MAG: DNA mismatch repair protein MutS [Vampirovibrionales bacterium]|nr:DNA mismatch repair protein MutS [Vampirovibrionales bacterium]